MPDAYQSAKSSLPPDPGGGGVVSFASWEELENVLRRAGAVRPGESVNRFVVSELGISFYLEQH